MPAQDTLGRDAFFRTVPSVREQFPELEQERNNDPAIPTANRAETQTHITRCHGALATFIVRSSEEEDPFKGAGDQAACRKPTSNGRSAFIKASNSRDPCVAALSGTPNRIATPSHS